MIYGFYGRESHQILKEDHFLIDSIYWEDQWCFALSSFAFNILLIINVMNMTDSLKYFCDIE